MLFFKDYHKEFDEIYILMTPTKYTDGLNHVTNYIIMSCSTNISSLQKLKKDNDIIVCQGCDTFYSNEAVLHIAHNTLSNDLMVSTESKDITGYLSTYSQLDRYNWNIYTFPVSTVCS